MAHANTHAHTLQHMRHNMPYGRCRHVLEHIAKQPAAGSTKSSFPAGGGLAGDRSCGQFSLGMLTAMPDPTATATDHEQVTLMFADIVGFTRCAPLPTYPGLPRVALSLTEPPPKAPCPFPSIHSSIQGWRRAGAA